MPNHDIATEEVAPFIEAMIVNHHELVEAGVTFDVLFAFGENGQPAGVKHAGFPATSTVKKNGPTLRKRGLPDATIVVEGAEWELMTDARRFAEIDRCLAFVVVARNAKGEITEDEAGRPKIKVGPPDYRIDGFRAVADRHGEDSVEVRDAQAFRENYGPLLFGDEPAEVSLAIA